MTIERFPVTGQIAKVIVSKVTRQSQEKGQLLIPGFKVLVQLRQCCAHMLQKAHNIRCLSQEEYVQLYRFTESLCRWSSVRLRYGLADHILLSLCTAKKLCDTDSSEGR